ncbi:MAG TPA: biopolymer transporter ExbD [Chromatiaceae bacterium]|nr:biopolymer transporter ExbD [Chromatiaceae bacterium]
MNNSLLPNELEEEEAEISLTPMLDIIFILLIFFIVTTSFTKSLGIEVERPSAVTSKPMDNQSLSVAIGPDGAITLDGKPASLTGLRAALQRRSGTRPESALITADIATDTGILVQVMDQLRLSGIEALSLATTSQPKE